MGHSAHIDIRVGDWGTGPVAIIEQLLRDGWTGVDDGHIVYLPLGDEGDFDWAFAELAQWPEVLELLREKERQRELIGLAITWRDTGVGGTLHLSERDDRMWFSCNINRPLLMGCGRFTDFGWYASKLIPSLMSQGVTIEALAYTESELG